MSKLEQRIEVFANVLIIVVAVLLIGVLAQKYFYNVDVISSPSQIRIQPTVGTRLPELNLSYRPKTLILVLQKGCRYCDESASFYKRLAENVNGKNVKLVAVLPGKVEESAAYLRDLGISDLDIRQMVLRDLHVSGTPTLILANDEGSITRFWIGKLTAEKEHEVINELSS